MAQTIARAYFIDAATGAELNTHPANGSPFGWSGPGFLELPNGQRITPADFDRPVRMKRWFGPNCEFNDVIDFTCK